MNPASPSGTGCPTEENDASDGRNLPELRVFTYREGVAVETVLFEGKLWISHRGACAGLGLNDTKAAARRLDLDEKKVIHRAVFAGQANRGVSDTPLLRGNPTRLFISESGLYKLIMRSDKAEALAFQNWLAREVIPVALRTGQYVPTTTEPAPRQCDCSSHLARIDANIERLTLAWEATARALVQLAGFPVEFPPGVELAQIAVGPAGLPRTRRANQRLTADTVAKCRRLHRSGVSIYRLAIDHGISDSSMRSAVRGQTYRYVSEPPVA